MSHFKRLTGKGSSKKRTLIEGERVLGGNSHNLSVISLENGLGLWVLLRVSCRLMAILGLLACLLKELVCLFEKLDAGTCAVILACRIWLNLARGIGEHGRHSVLVTRHPLCQGATIITDAVALLASLLENVHAARQSDSAGTILIGVAVVAVVAAAVLLLRIGFASRLRQRVLRDRRELVESCQLRLLPWLGARIEARAALVENT